MAFSVFLSFAIFFFLTPSWALVVFKKPFWPLSTWLQATNGALWCYLKPYQGCGLYPTQTKSPYTLQTVPTKGTRRPGLGSTQGGPQPARPSRPPPIYSPLPKSLRPPWGLRMLSSTQIAHTHLHVSRLCTCCNTCFSSISHITLKH